MRDWKRINKADRNREKQNDIDLANCLYGEGLLSFFQRQMLQEAHREPIWNRWKMTSRKIKTL